MNPQQAFMDLQKSLVDELYSGPKTIGHLVSKSHQEVFAVTIALGQLEDYNIVSTSDRNIGQVKTIRDVSVISYKLTREWEDVIHAVDDSYELTRMWEDIFNIMDDYDRRNQSD